MKKLYKKIISVFSAAIIFALCVGVVGCNQQEDSKGPEVIASSSMYKYEQRYQFSESEKANRINIRAAANEYEPVQIIISANEEKVESYNLTTADLISATGKIIEKKNVSVYSAYYNSISNSLNGFPGGYYPDVLIPLEDRVQYGDNQVNVNEIQSLWVSIYIPKGTDAGDYTGNFTVTVNGKDHSVSITLTVYGFELPDETHVKSSFGIRGFSYGEDNFTNIYGDRAREAANAYYEFLLKYRVAAPQLPNSDLFSANEWVDKAVEYASRVDVPSFSIRFQKGSSEKYDSWFDETYLRDVLSMLVDRSTEEQNVFEKLFARGVIDEPDYTKQYEKTRDFVATVNSIVQTVLEEKDTAGAFEGKPSVREGLKNLQTLITLCNWGEDIGGDIGTDITGYCPKLYLFDNEQNCKEFAELQENNIGIWTYTCNEPGWPYPTYQIDADLVSPRSIGAIQMRYNIEGNLFWGVNLSHRFNGMEFVDTWDPYTSHYAYSNWPGDGYLLVRSGRYDSQSIVPYPTMRLEMIREGQEDYEYLYMLKALVARKGDEAMQMLLSALEVEYAKILDGVKPTEDPEKMIAFKEKLANMILENL